MTFKEELALTIVDKVVIGLAIIAIGYFVSIKVESFRFDESSKQQQASEQRQYEHQLAAQRQTYLAQLDIEAIQNKNELEKEKQNAKAEIEKEKRVYQLQLQEAIAKDRDTRNIELIAHQLSDFYWPLYLHIERDNIISEKLAAKWKGNFTDRRLGEQLEKSVVLPNHEAIVKIIEDNIYIADCGPELLQQIKLYLRHVAVYKALRDSGSRDDPSKFNEPWPKELFPLVKKKLESLQKAYNLALKATSASDGKEAQQDAAANP